MIKQRLALHGGAPAAQRNWPTWPVWDDAERRGLIEVLESGKWWFGERIGQFESAYAAFHHVRYGVSCTNGTTAIEMGLRGIGVLPGDEVIIPAYSFIATASAVVTVGAIPVFADIEPDTLCLDPIEVQRKITPRTKAIIPVHVAGRFADMAHLADVAARHGLEVLEDAAHAWGSLFDGKGPGTIGRCATFSFQVTKNITAGEGGILLTNEEALAGLCRSYTHCGPAQGIELVRPRLPRQQLENDRIPGCHSARAAWATRIASAAAREERGDPGREAVEAGGCAFDPPRATDDSAQLPHVHPAARRARDRRIPRPIRRGAQRRGHARQPRMVPPAVRQPPVPQQLDRTRARHHLATIGSRRGLQQRSMPSD